MGYNALGAVKEGDDPKEDAQQAWNGGSAIETFTAVADIDGYTADNKEHVSFKEEEEASFLIKSLQDHPINAEISSGAAGGNRESHLTNGRDHKPNSLSLSESTFLLSSPTNGQRASGEQIVQRKVSSTAVVSAPLPAAVLPSGGSIIAPPPKADTVKVY